jgi:hypothetical protein
MAKKKPNKITIDFDLWETQANAAKSQGIKQTTLSQRMLRGKIDKWFIPELGITLVKKSGK